MFCENAALKLKLIGRKDVGFMFHSFIVNSLLIDNCSGYTFFCVVVMEVGECNKMINDWECLRKIKKLFASGSL